MGRLYIWFLPVFVILACCKERNLDFGEFRSFESGTQEYGWARSNVNDKTWEASAYYETAFNDSSKIYVSFETYETFAQEFVRESISFSLIAKDYKVAKYSLIDNDGFGKVEIDSLSQLFCGMLLLAGDGHFQGTEYVLNEDRPNFFEITSWDSTSQVMKGKFDLSFKKIKNLRM